MFCGSCGTENPDGAQFCRRCGRELRPGMSGRPTRNDVYGAGSTPDPRRVRNMTTGAASDPGPWQRNKTVRTLGIVTAALATLVVVMLVVRMVAVNPRKTLDRGGLDAERVEIGRAHV